MLLFSGEKDLSVGGATDAQRYTVVTKMAEMAAKLRSLDCTTISRAAWFSRALPEARQRFLQSR